MKVFLIQRWVVFKKNELQPHRKKQWYIGKLNALFLARMNLILRLYLLPSNPLRSVLYFDKNLCFLIGDTVEGLAIKSGQVAKENYAYTKHEACSLLAMIKPLTEKDVFTYDVEDERKSLHCTCKN